jgi:hypothetical protein
MGKGMCNSNLPPRKLNTLMKQGKFLFFLNFVVFIIIFSIPIVHSLTYCYFWFCKVASKIIIFREALQFKEVIILCYNMQIFMKMNARIPSNITHMLD